ncbi:MAG: gas vesicle protein GvpO [Candidatus Hydrothermarchaeota archaeon]|nr:gas vesicle protein GvpO [Candidatus Hydrothermarchaeota archaeon]
MAKKITKAEKEDIKEIGKSASSLIESLLNKKPEGVISVTKEGKEWKVAVEVLERKAVPDTQDILGKYELRLDENENILGYKRIALRRRAELGEEE